jgi:hypothetical protein
MKLASSLTNQSGLPHLVAITVSEFLTVSSFHTCNPDTKRRLLAASSRFYREEPAVRKALTAATSFSYDGTPTVDSSRLSLMRSA